MKNLFYASHNMWIATQLRSPAWFQNAVIPQLHQAKELLRWRPYLTVHRLSGQNQGGPLTVDYVGLNYKPTLSTVLFEEDPTVKKFGQVATRQIHTLTERSDSDMVVVVGSKNLIQKLVRQNGLVLPFYVNMVLDVRGDWQEVRERVHKSVRNYEFRLVRKYGYEYHMTSLKEDFETFFHTMYVPTIKARKGGLASPMSFREAYQYFKQGHLLLVTRDGRDVAGGLSYVQKGVVSYKLIGALNSDPQLIHEGALGASYYAMVHWANQQQYQSVDFGGCVPQLANSVFQYKRKWGAAVTYSNTVHRQILIKVRRDTPAVRQFFKDNPLIIMGEKQKLQGLIVTDNAVISDNTGNINEETRNQLHKQYGTPGLHDLLICSVTDLFDKNGSVF